MYWPDESIVRLSDQSGHRLSDPGRSTGRWRSRVSRGERETLRRNGVGVYSGDGFDDGCSHRSPARSTRSPAGHRKPVSPKTPEGLIHAAHTGTVSPSDTNHNHSSIIKPLAEPCEACPTTVYASAGIMTTRVSACRLVPSRRPSPRTPPYAHWTHIGRS